MKGKYHIIIENKFVKYEFDIKRHYTKIIGNSSKGKTYMINLVRSPYSKIICDVPVIAPLPRTWKEDISNKNNCIIILDEDTVDLTSDNSAKLMNNSNNYFILISREDFSNLSYSPEEVYTIESNQFNNEPVHYNSVKPNYIFNTLKKIYDFNTNYNISAFIESGYKLITEDSNSGYQFFNAIFKDSCSSGNGKQQLISKLMNDTSSNNFIVIVDGAAFGSCMHKLLYVIDNFKLINKNIIVLMPESFEWLLLKVKFGHKYYSHLYETYNFCDFASWETYYTELLKYLTIDDKVFKYSKSRLSIAYHTYKDKVLQELNTVSMISSSYEGVTDSENNNLSITNLFGTL